MSVALWLLAIVLMAVALLFADHGAEANNPPSFWGGLVIGAVALLVAHVA